MTNSRLKFVFNQLFIFVWPWTNSVLWYLPVL